MIWPLVTSVSGATWYVDSSASGSHNGMSWANAWTSFSQISGVSAGDIIYISGGSSGNSQTYSSPSFKGGSSSSSRITYQIGQDSSHNGTAIFSGSGDFITVGNINVIGDAGDGKMHFTFSGGGRVFNTSASNVHISYCNFGTRSSYFIYDNGGTGLEFDHFYGYKSNSGGDDGCVYLNGGTAAWDINKIHDGWFDIIRSESGSGDDGIQGGPNGLSMYNMTFVGVGGSYGGSQHQDGFQVTSGSYLKIYNCVFQDIANYPVFGDAYWGPLNHFWVYNCIAYIRDSNIQSSAPPRAFCIMPDGSYSASETWTDDHIWNCTVVDYGSSAHAAVQMENQGSGNHITFSGCSVVNCVAVNSAGGYWLDGNVTSTDNILLTSSQGAADFTHYTTLSGTNNNMMPASSASAIVGAGQNLSSYFTTDMAGNSRPASGAWDIGAYEFTSGAGGGANQLPTVNAGLDQSITFPNTASLNGVVSNPAGGTLVLAWSKVSGPGTVTFSSPNTAATTASFTTAGSYVLQLAATNSQGSASDNLTVTVSSGGPDATPPTISVTAPVSGAVVSNNVTLSATASDNTGGSGVSNVVFLVDGAVVGSDTASPYSITWNSQSVTNGSHTIQAVAQDVAGNSASSTAVNVTVRNPGPLGMSFQAESGVITAPFTVSGGYISQSVQTTTEASGGRAVYTFFVPTNGDYVVTATFDAPSDGENSIFLNIDGEPVDPTMIWDMPITSGFENHTASWRGSGTSAADEFVPKVFLLPAGQHTLIIVGREPNVSLDSIQIQTAPSQVTAPPAPPSNLVVIGQ